MSALHEQELILLLAVNCRLKSREGLGGGRRGRSLRVEVEQRNRGETQYSLKHTYLVLYQEYSFAFFSKKSKHCWFYLPTIIFNLTSLSRTSGCRQSYCMQSNSCFNDGGGGGGGGGADADTRRCAPLFNSPCRDAPVVCPECFAALSRGENG